MTQEVLIESIEHWKRLEKCETPEEFEREGYGCQSCALCKIYLNGEKRWGCHGCPIKEDTGRLGCDGTPYGDALCAITEFIIKGDKLNRGPITREREYLESLLTKIYNQTTV